MASKPTYIGLDLGRSAVKVTARQGDKSHSLMFPSAVAKARPVVFENLQESASIDTVMLKGEEYWTGKTALVQSMGADPVGRNDDWVIGTDHDVLVAAAIHRLRAAGLEFSMADAYVTLGVPSRVFRQRRDLVTVVRRNVQAALTEKKDTPHVYVQAQPMGVIAKYTLDPAGYTAQGRDLAHDSFAVIEVGQFTTDMTAVVKGQPVIEATDSVEGVELLVNHVRSRLRERGLELGIIDVQQLLANPKMKARGETIDLSAWVKEAMDNILMPQILQAAKTTFNPLLLQSVDAILIAGGGAPIVFPGVKAVNTMQHAELLENPREAVADGFARLSALMHLSAGSGNV